MPESIFYDWAAEHENPQYILDLPLLVITVSMKTVDIVGGRIMN
jgi:predicted helicase